VLSASIVAVVEEANTHETSVKFNETTLHSIPEDIFILAAARN
jgi:hypothetical protein